MGVDFNVCGICGETFPDCGVYYNCGECEDFICADCYDEQLEKYGKDERPSTIGNYGGDCTRYCDECTPLIVRDNDIVRYLIDKYNLNIKSVKKTILKKHKYILEKQEKED